MKKILCTVNADQINDHHKRSLESALRTNYSKHLSVSEKTRVIWCELPADQGYTSYEQPCVSLVVIEADDGLDQADRESMLSDCAKDWERITGTALERLMISVFDQAKFLQYMSANRQRLSTAGRIRFALHMAFSLVRSKMTRGLFVFDPNLGN